MRPIGTVVLPLPCTGKQQQRSLRGQHGLTLHIVQLRKLPLDVIFRAVRNQNPFVLS